MHRGEGYEDIKKIFAERMFNEGLYKYYPKTKGKVTHYDIGTPLTNQFYLSAYSGEAYGLDSTPYRYSKAMELKPKTEIENLYLTGQDICTLGFTGALMGGLLTAHSILGYGSIIDIIKGRNLVNDLINLENKIK
jgi:all-trans-retinol 13,14-reductase